MKKIRLLVDAHIFDKERQGITTYIKGLYNVFQEKYSDEYEIFLFADNVELLAKEFPNIPKSNLIKVPTKSSFHRLVIQIPQVIKEYRIDYAHFQQIAPLVKNCKYIITIHDLLFNDLPDKFSLFYRISRNILFKKALKQSEIKLTVSNFSKESIKQYFNIDGLHITPNAISGDFKVDYNKDDVERYIKDKYNIQNYILFVSRIEERKNHLMLLKAYRKLELYKRGVQLVFVGRNDIPVIALEKEVESLNEEERAGFCWMSRVDDGELVKLYQGARLFAYPSYAEGFGIPPIEAVALGINTISSCLTAMGDYTFLEKNLFDPNDFDAFCHLLNANLQTPPSKEVLDKRRKTVWEKYNWDTSATVLHNSIQDDLGKTDK